MPLTPSKDPQDFVNFWMDDMWAQRKQRNYIKLALVLQSIAKREQRNVELEFDEWCDRAKYHQWIYFSQHDPQTEIKALS